MDIPSIYDHIATEDKWYSHWSAKGYFHSTPDEREPYTIVIPPPNVTGVLHMGHMLNNTIQDVLIRRARMLGYNACWVPGYDHASIATEAKVVAKLKSEGIEKFDLTRDEFLEHAWEWKEKHGGIILEQLKKLGASCDWERTRFTMEEDLTEAVLDVFIDLYAKGKIYRGYRMVNWDPVALTAVSDEEVIHEEVQSKLYHVRYPIEGAEDAWVIIATTRPETILGDTAVCVNPNDERYQHLKGKRVEVPFTGRTVPIIFDDYVAMDFGTGCLKVTPAHDQNDKEIGERHNLAVLDILNDDATLNEKAGRYIGEDRFVVRKKIVEDLDAAGFLVKTEDYMNKVGLSERTKAVIEPKLSLQWFVRMKEISEKALEVVMNDEVALVPPKFKNTYRHWMENVRDWCISRQLWWGQRIPAWHYGKEMDDYVVAKTEERALDLARKKTGNYSLTAADLKQDEDVVDTWFSSWLWPISVFDGFKDPENADINYYYPTNTLVTAPEILFFWVARMVIAGYDYRGKRPFKDVYLTGIVRDQLRQKMSKSLGNSPDPLDLIAKYGADGVRVGMLLSSPAGNDLLFDEKLCQQGRNFTNKIWNALRLVKSWEVSEAVSTPEENNVADQWFTAVFQDCLKQLNAQYDQFRMSDALMSNYKLVWDEFCSRYLEMVKPAYGQPIDKATMERTIYHFEQVLRVVQPWTPFIAEEIWHLLRDRTEGDDLIIASWPTEATNDACLLAGCEVMSEVVSQIRNFRKKQNVPNKTALQLLVKGEVIDHRFDALTRKLGILDDLQMITEKPSGAHRFVVGTNEYFIPVAGTIDVEAETVKLKEELDYQQGFLGSVMKKLGNERFVNNAPAKVVEMEQKKKADAEARIRLIEEQLSNLKG